MFAEEQPALAPLPLEPFRYYRYGQRAMGVGLEFVRGWSENATFSLYLFCT
jgi:hypothetical protein